MKRRLLAPGALAADFLPHGAPFLLLDRIVAVDAGSGRFTKGVAADDPLLAPGGVLPPLLVVEAMAQAAGLVLMHREPALRRRTGAALAAIDGCTVADDARAGDLLEIEVTVVRRYGDMARVRGRASVAGRTCVTAALTLAFGPAESDEE